MMPRIIIPIALLGIATLVTICKDSPGLILVQTSIIINRQSVDGESSSDESGSDDVAEVVPTRIKKKRRRHLHLCPNYKRSGHGYNILRHEFGFHSVDATDSDNWDLIFGGYLWCGADEHIDDYNMETGLNQQLLRQGFDTLQPHQVYHPCMGCPDTFCNKEKLCHLQRSIDPTSCYILPQDYHAIKKRMMNETSSDNKSYVLKHDSSTSAVHSGKGVRIIHSVLDLPTPEELRDDTGGYYLVQPFQRSYLGKGSYQRTTEVRYYVAITSVTPLRVYYFNDLWMPLSSTLWVDDPPSELYKRCMQDSHVYKKSCKKVATPHMDDGASRRIRFTDYQNITGMPKKIANRFHEQATNTMTRIFQSSLPALQNNTINRGITSSGASCFSFMRADFGIGQQGDAFLYEINEFPYGTEPGTAGEVQRQAYRDLFRMIGLDAAPMLPQHRAEYEAMNSGNWTLLPTNTNANDDDKDDDNKISFSSPYLIHPNRRI